MTRDELLAALTRERYGDPAQDLIESAAAEQRAEQHRQQAAAHATALAATALRLITDNTPEPQPEPSLGERIDQLLAAGHTPHHIANQLHISTRHVTRRHRRAA